MQSLERWQLDELIGDLQAELVRLEHLSIAVRETRVWIEQEPTFAPALYESLALKLHNFYTGCERIFMKISRTINGGVPTDAAWHRILLDRMQQSRQNRPAVIQAKTAQQLSEYLGFRHVVRNVYGYELSAQRIDALVQEYSAVWPAFQADIQSFLQWLEVLAQQL